MVDAAGNGTFHASAVKTVIEGLENLTGLPAGGRKEDGTWPEGSIKFLVDKRPEEMSKNLKTDVKGDGNMEKG